MRLIIQGERIAATATDEYTGPEAWIAAPADFDMERMGDYRYIDGTVVLPAAGVPTEVPRWAGLLALKRHVLTDGALEQLAPEESSAGSFHAQVMVYRGTMPDGEARDRLDAALEHAKDWVRASPTVDAVRLILGLSPEQVDALFLWAAVQQA